MVVVPPATAAAVPESQSSAVIVPPNGMSMCVWASMKPGITRSPRTSTVSAPSPGTVVPTDAMRPSRIAMSASNVPSAVTTVPPRRFRSPMPHFSSSAVPCPRHPAGTGDSLSRCRPR